MLSWIAAFFVIALVAAVFGFSDIAAGAAGIAQVLFWIFLVMFVATLLLNLVRRGVPREQ